MAPKTRTYRFRLYILGGQVGSARAEPDLRHALDAAVPGEYELEVIDLRARPDLAQADRVIAAPTVIRLAPEPSRRVIGSLADPRSVAAALGLPAK
jgi:circadian clock protein KaiB